MLPLSIQKRFAQPGKLEAEFLNYLRKANAPIDQSKTIAYEVLYHGLDVSNQSSVDFFTGALVQNQTNIRGSFVRPQSEHFVIYGIRGYQYLNPEGPLQNFCIPWVKGFTATRFTEDVSECSIVNAQMSVQVNSVRMLKYVPLTEFDNVLTTKDRGTMILDQPILWQGQTELKLTVETNDANTTLGRINQGEGAQYLRFDLVGIGLI